MRLNKLQKAWIDRLMSGKTRKYQRALADGKGRNCCLGVAVNACKLERIRDISRSPDNLENFVLTKKALKLDDIGRFDITKVSQKWLTKLREYYLCDSSSYDKNSLVYMNDNTDMTHKDIGEFINENREAVFKG